MEIGIVSEIYISSDDMEYESDDYMETRYDEIIPNDAPFVQSSYNIYDNYFDHLEEISIFFVLFDNIKIHNLLKLRRINRFFRDIVNEYMILDDSKRIFKNIIFSNESFIQMGTHTILKYNIFEHLKKQYLNGFVLKHEHIINDEYENKFSMVKYMREYTRLNHIKICKKFCTYLYMNNRVYTMCHCKDCYHNYNMKWHYMVKRYIFNMRKSVLLENNIFI